MDITEIVVAVIGLLGTIVTVVVVPLIRSKTTAEQQKELAKWVQIGVSAAEQMFTQTGLGAQKKEHVIKLLRAQGFDVDDEKVLQKVDALIEAFVAGLNGRVDMMII